LFNSTSDKDLMTKGEYKRLNNLLKAVAESHKRFAYNMLKADKRFAVTEQAIADLIKATKNRRSSSS